MERTISCADIKPQVYPLSLELLGEEFMNSSRYGATKLNITFRQMASGDYGMEVRCNSTGNVDRARLLSPSAVNGGGTSRYAAGLPVARLKRGNPGDAYEVLWKKADESWYHAVTNTEDGTSPKRLNTPASPWTSAAEHGFIHRCLLRKETLEKFGEAKGVTIDGIPTAVQEICCVKMMPDTLESLDITVTVFNEAGAMVGTSNSREHRWMPFETALTQVSDRVKTDYRVSQPVTEKLNTDTRYLHVSIPKGTPVPGFPRYGVTNLSWTFIGADGFYTAVPTKDTLDRASHASSLSGRVIFAKLSIEEGADVDSYPTPASTKNSFLGTCPVYRRLLACLNAAKPAGYAVFAKKSATPAPARTTPPAPTKVPRGVVAANEQWHETTHGRSIVGESDRKKDEDEKKYLQRIGQNRSSKKSKSKRKEGSSSAATSPASSVSSDGMEPGEVAVVQVAVQADEASDDDMLWAQANLERLQRMLARRDICDLLGWQVADE